MEQNFHTETYRGICISNLDVLVQTLETCSQGAFQGSGESGCQTPGKVRKQLWNMIKTTRLRRKGSLTLFKT